MIWGLKLMELAQKTFLITGGASGLGAATTRLFRESGANVVILDMNEEAGEQTAHEAGAAFVKTDVVNEDSVANAIAVAISAYGRINGVVNCAGVGVAGKVLGKKGPLPLAQFTKVISVNLIGTFNVIRLAASAISQSEPDADGERGVIINTASVATFEGQIGQAAYSASKGGIASMTLPIARELAEYGIRVVSIAPGIFDTPMLGALPEEVRKSLGAQVPFPKRLGLPKEYAALARHIVENRMLNGEVIRLDGAIRMAPR
jgi:NAD(P)-dependent dehydrogenase (short-subunit alcohol dehydrogenase family)